MFVLILIKNNQSVLLGRPVFDIKRYNAQESAHRAVVAKKLVVVA